MRTGKYVILIILICAGCFSISFSPILALAQSSSVSPPTVSLPAYIYEGPIPGGYIIGYVLDEDGNPVPEATVSLLLDGQLWDPEKYNYPESDRNPQLTRVAYYNTDELLHEGGFLFGLPMPDNYTLEAEKGGYKGSAVVHVPRELLYKDTTVPFSKVITVNITLKGLLQATFSPEQLAYTGAVVGNITNLRRYHTEIRNISLLQDGRLVPLPNNPQDARQRHYAGQTVNYIFEHLAPGHYTVIVEYDTFHPMGPPMYNDTVTADVSTGTTTANLELSHVAHDPPEPIIPTPVDIPIPTEKAEPSPALAWWVAPLVIVTMTYVILRKREH